MSVVGLDEVTLSAEDVATGKKFLRDFGFAEIESGATGGTYHAKNGTGIRVRSTADGGLPRAMAGGPNIHEALWGVSDAASLAAIGANLGADREVRTDAEGTLHATDDDGNAIAFRVTRRRGFTVAPVHANVPGLAPARKVNETADFDARIEPCTFSHLVMFTPDLKRAEAFYTKRLGYRVTDRFTGTGVFLRAPGSTDHHNLFFISRPGAPTNGLNHVAFHLRDVTEVMLAGIGMTKKGWESAWGPGRHIFGSNHFWYFKSPFGGTLEYDADMDVVDDNWRPRETMAGPAAAAIWQTEYHPGAKH